MRASHANSATYRLALHGGVAEEERLASGGVSRPPSFRQTAYSNLYDVCTQAY